MKNSNLLVFATLFFLTSGEQSIYGQTEFSTNFRHGTDIWNKACELTEQDLCKTTFIRETVENLLRAPNIAYVQTGYIKVEDKGYFILYAMNAINTPIDFVIGSYPCPQDCLPPEAVITKGILEGYTKFDIADLNAVLDTTTRDVTYLSVRIGQFREVNSPGFNIAYIVYGARGKYIRNDAHSVTDYDDPHDPIFISIE